MSGEQGAEKLGPRPAQAERSPSREALRRNRAGARRAEAGARRECAEKAEAAGVGPRGIITLKTSGCVAVVKSSRAPLGSDILASGATESHPPCTGRGRLS